MYFLPSYFLLGIPTILPPGFPTEIPPKALPRIPTRISPEVTSLYTVPAGLIGSPGETVRALEKVTKCGFFFQMESEGMGSETITNLALKILAKNILEQKFTKSI